MKRCMQNKQAKRDCNVSKDVIEECIQVIQNVREKDLIKELKDSPFPFRLQIDESTHVTGLCRLVGHARYMLKEWCMYVMREDFLLSVSTLVSTGADGIFNTVFNHLSEKGLLDKVGSVCTDGAKPLRDTPNSFTAKMKQVNPGVLDLHCALHCLNLATQMVVGDLSETLYLLPA